MENINNLRSLNSLGGILPKFDTDNVPEKPHELFVEWLSFAMDKGIQEPHAMTLSTVDKGGFPDARVLILKKIDSLGWYFSTSSSGRKGQQLNFRSKVALTFYWPLLGKQIRIRGAATNVDKEASAKDFLARSETARAVALIERQSEVMANQNELEEALLLQQEKMKQEPKLVLPSWSLYCVKAEEVEFWQGDTERKHTRLQYRLEGKLWQRELLWP